MKEKLKIAVCATCLLFVLIMGAVGYLSIQRANERLEPVASSNTQMHKITIELVDELAKIANDAGLKVTDKQKEELVKKFIEDNYKNVFNMKPTPGGGPPE